ncbi:MAG: flagellar hook-length control protein FliK [Pelagimonas sp.]
MLNPLMTTVGAAPTPPTGEMGQQASKTDNDLDFAKILAGQDAKASKTPNPETKLAEDVEKSAEASESDDAVIEEGVGDDAEIDLDDMPDGDEIADFSDENADHYDDADYGATDEYVGLVDPEYAEDDGLILTGAEHQGENPVVKGAAGAALPIQEAQVDALRAAMLGTPVSATSSDVAKADVGISTTQQVDTVSQAIGEVSETSEDVPAPAKTVALTSSEDKPRVTPELVVPAERGSAPKSAAVNVPEVAKVETKAPLVNEGQFARAETSETVADLKASATSAAFAEPAKPRVVQSRPLPAEAVMAAKAEMAGLSSVSDLPGSTKVSASEIGVVASPDGSQNPVSVGKEAGVLAEAGKPKPDGSSLGEQTVQEKVESRLYADRRESGLVTPKAETVQFDSRQNLKTASVSVREAVFAASNVGDTAQKGPEVAQMPAPQSAVMGAGTPKTSFVFPETAPSAPSGGTSTQTTATAAAGTAKADVQPVLADGDTDIEFELRSLGRTEQSVRAEGRSIEATQQAMATHAETRAVPSATQSDAAKVPPVTQSPQTAQVEPTIAEPQSATRYADDMIKSSEFVQVVQQATDKRRESSMSAIMAKATGTETSVKAVAPSAPGAVIHPSVSDGSEDAVVEQALSQFSESRSTQANAAPAPQQPQQQARAEAANVMRQVSENLNKMSNGGVEIRLSPEELGSVRLQMAPSEHGMVVTIQADRPETLDLMRRNIDQLAQDLAAAGYEGAEFSFGDDGQGSASGGQGQTTKAEPVIEEQDAEPRPQTTTDGLDIRV